MIQNYGKEYRMMEWIQNGGKEYKIMGKKEYRIMEKNTEWWKRIQNDGKEYKINDGKEYKMMVKNTGSKIKITKCWKRLENRNTGQWKSV